MSIVVCNYKMSLNAVVIVVCCCCFLYSVSSGVKALIVIVVVLVLGSCTFIGVTLFVMYKRKKSSRVRTVNVGQDSTGGNYRMPGVTEQENIATAAPPPRYTPSPFIPIVVSQENDNSQNPPSHFTPIVLQQENDNSQNPPSHFTPIVLQQENDNSQNPPSHFTPIVLQQENANSQNQIITETATVQEEDIEDGDENKPLMS